MTIVKKILLPVLFLGFLLLHFLDGFFEWLPEPEINEQRALAPRPRPDINFLDPFPRDYEAYYQDHFNWRNYFIKAGTYLNYYTFKKSSLPDKVLIGKEGWLFKGGFQLDIYRGKFLFTSRQLAAITKELERRKAVVETHGAKYYLAVPPLKHTIYPEYLPDNVRKLNAQTCTEQLIQYLHEHSTIDYIDLRAPILQEKRQSDSLLYFKTDHHWNARAGLVATQTILKQLQKTYPQLDTLKDTDYSLGSSTYDGMTLAQMLGMEKTFQERIPFTRPKFRLRAVDSLRTYPPPADFPFGQDYVIDKRTGRSDLPSLFVVRESFATLTIAPLAEHFDRSFFLFDNWKHRFNEAIFLAEKPDIYLQMVWEGMIFNLLEDPPEGAGW